MLSIRYLTVVTLAVAAVNALPTTDKPINKDVAILTDDQPFFDFPIFAGFFEPIWKLFPSFSTFGPSVFSDNNKFEIVISANDYAKEDLKVKVKGSLLIIQGTHESKVGDRDLVASQFFNTYTLPLNASSADVKAELTSDKFLVVTALINGPGDKSNKNDRDITIVETDTPLEKQGENTERPSYGTSSYPEIDDDRREETTPASERESTIKDNSIPHGNEVIPL